MYTCLKNPYKQLVTPNGKPINHGGFEQGANMLAAANGVIFEKKTWGFEPAHGTIGESSRAYELRRFRPWDARTPELL